jgi:CHASE2 domain-containing sensor protein
MFIKSTSLTFRNKKLLVHFSAAFTAFLLYIFFIEVNDGPWTAADYRVNDILYRTSLTFDHTAPESNRILYLTITDKTYQEVFKNHHFRRDIFADIFNKVSSLDPEYILIDLIFAYPSDDYSDSLLINEITSSDNVFIPLPLTNNNTSHIDNTFLRTAGLSGIKQNGETGSVKLRSYIPDIMTRSKILNYGHVNVFPDEDGVFRHSSILLPVDSFLIPSISLRLFMSYCGVVGKDISVDWGNNVTIHPDSSSWITNDIIIPIDKKGRMYIPFSAKWGEDFLHISVNRFLELYNIPGQRSRLQDLFEGRIIVIGDVSTGISDLANTTLDDNVPLITLSAHELNAYLSSTYYREFNSLKTILFSLIILTVLYLLSVIYNYRYYAYTGLIILLLIILAASILFLQNYFIPTASLAVYGVSAWLLMFISIGLTKYKENKHIKEEMIKKKYDLDQARKLQLSLLPDKLPSNEYLEITAYLQSADEVSGDYYDIRCKDEEILLVLGDVIGHGLKAGMMSLIIKTIFSSLPDKVDLKEIFAQVNSSIKKFKIEMFYLGLLLARIIKRKITVLSAGMPPLIYYDSTSGQVKEIIIKSPPLGILKFNYEPVEMLFSPGDIILAYSDGLSELFNPQNEMLGTERIMDHLYNNKEKDLLSLKRSFLEMIDSWTAGGSPHDDITFILIKIKL